MSENIENDTRVAIARGTGEKGTGLKSCGKSDEYVAELLLAPVPVADSSSTGTLNEARIHVESCPVCLDELAELRSTMALMDEWSAPDPTAYFDTRLMARLRSEQAAAPAGWFERVRARFLFGSNMQLRPLAAGVLALMLLAGGGTFAGINLHQRAVPAESATVHDLQNLDGNDQVFQQLDTLDQNDNDSDDPSTL